jgi:hypothetical protein
VKPFRSTVSLLTLDVGGSADPGENPFSEMLWPDGRLVVQLHLDDRDFRVVHSTHPDWPEGGEWSHAETTVSKRSRK